VSTFPGEGHPVSRAILRSNRRAALDLLVHHLGNRPQKSCVRRPQPAGRWQHDADNACSRHTKRRFERHRPGDRAGLGAPFRLSAARLTDWTEKMNLRAFANRGSAQEREAVSGTLLINVLFTF
jgi:hypothetical protein